MVGLLLSNYNDFTIPTNSEVSILPFSYSSLSNTSNASFNIYKSFLSNMLGGNLYSNFFIPSFSANSLILS